MELGEIIWEAVSVAVIVFSALAVFMVRRSPSSEAPSLSLWLRFSILAFVGSVIVIAEGVLLRPFGFFWLVLVGGVTLVLVAKCGPKFLKWEWCEGRSSIKATSCGRRWLFHATGYGDGKNKANTPR